ncbi:MAG: arginine deiminase [Lachnospiraceae bacterium]|nr:arginine deiminase [Lachnospiraceae bacterium]
MNGIRVHSEIGPLKKVMLHRPGKELEHLVPEDMERLLFDDIPYLRAAQAEHDRFAQMLKGQGTRVVYLEDLAAEVLGQDPGIKKRFLQEFIGEGDVPSRRVRDNLYDFFMEIPDNKELVQKMMSGVRADELKIRTRGPLVSLLRTESSFLLDPLPNLYFTRDPFASIGTGASIHRMYSRTRCRETIFGKYILTYHPDFAGHTHVYYDRDMPYAIEGGDILNLSRKVLAIGISQRTMPEAIERLAENLFRDENCEIESILAMDIPAMRAYMRLDTVFTQVDRDKFTIHPGILRSLRVFEICKKEGSGSQACDRGLQVRERTESLEMILASVLELDSVTLIPCGGKDTIASEREQWNDGSNTLCIAPGKVIVYDRNVVTNQILRDYGIEVLEMPSSELSRGRGGPRCMSMPLIREEMNTLQRR